MNLSYNGVVLEICHFNDFQQHSVRSEDGTDRLMTHFMVDVTCIWNSAATASLNGLAQQPGPDFLGDRPALSITALRGLLLQERRTLMVSIGDQVILESPQLYTQKMFTDSDANNGPHPISLDVVRFQGIATAVVRYRIETWLHRGEVQLIRSNRWTTTENILEDFRKIIHVEGVAVFSQSILQVKISNEAGVSSADFYRDLVVPPPNDGFQRKNGRIALDSDGTRIYWSFDDEQPEGNYQLLPNSGVWKVDGYTFADRDWSGGLLGLPGLRLPDMTIGVHAEVWGRPQMKRQQIGNALMRILASIVGDLTSVMSRIGVRVRVQIDFPRRHGSLDYSFALSGLVGGSIVALITPSIADLPRLKLFQDFSATDVWVQGVGPRKIIAPGWDGIHGDPFPGNKVVQLLAAMLLLPGQEPELPVVNL